MRILAINDYENLNFKNIAFLSTAWLILLIEKRKVHKFNSCLKMSFVFINFFQFFMFKCIEMEQENVPVWVSLFKTNLSQKHFKYFNDKLELEVSQMGKIDLWFGTDRIGGESELSYAFRTLNRNGNFDKIISIKILMESLLLDKTIMFLVDQHPLTMLAEAMTESEFRFLISAMFEDKVAAVLSAQLWLRFVILFGKISTYFRQIYDKKKLKMKLENLWDSFIKILDQIRKEQTKLNQLMDQFYPILEQLEWKFGAQNIGQTFDSLITTYAHQMMVFYHENGTFHKKFETEKLGRERIKEFFIFIDEHQRKLPNEFWKLFDDANLRNNQHLATIKVTAKNSYLECPNMSAINEDFHLNFATKTYDENEGGQLMMAYAEILLQDNNNSEGILRNKGKTKEYEQKLETKAAIWVYKEMIGTELLGFANTLLLLDTNNTNGLVDKMYEKEWDKMTTKNGQSDETKLCALHKFALSLTKDETLKKNTQWNSHVEQLLSDTSPPFQLNGPKLILLLNDEEGINWAQVDCAGQKLAAKFVETIKRVPNWSDRMHFYALSFLIKNFVFFQSIFCYGQGTLPAITVKEKLREIVQANAFHAIERSFPEILHFETQLKDTYYEFLLKKLEHKSGTLLAQCYEARLSMPYKMKLVKDCELYLMQKSTEKGDDQMRHLIEEKIGQIKEKVYESTREEKPTEWRQTVCQLVKLEQFLLEICANPDNFTHNKISQWEPGCHTEKELTKAFYELRMSMKVCQHAAIDDFMKAETDKIMTIPGARTKLWKMLNEMEPETKIANFHKIMSWTREELKKRTKEVFGDNKRLMLHYYRILFADPKYDQIEQFLLADVIIFVRWIEEKLQVTRRSIAAKRTENIWESRKEKFELIYDRIPDEDEQMVGQLAESVGMFFNELKQYLEKGQTNAVLEDERWEGIITVFFDTKFTGIAPVDVKRLDVYEKWKQSLHKVTIAGLIKDEPTFADQLKNALSSNKKNVTWIMEKFLGVENAKEILGKLIKEMAPTLTPSKGKNKLDKLNFSGSNSPTTPNKKDNLSMEEKAKGKDKKEKKKVKQNNSENSNKNGAQNAKNSPKNAKNATQNSENEEKVQKEKEVKVNEKEINKKDEKIDKKIIKIEQNPKIKEIFSENICTNEYIGITLGNFEEDIFLAKKFRNFFDFVTKNSDCGDSSMCIDSLTQLIHFGVFANEISHRLKLIKSLKGIFQQIVITEIEKEWHQLKGFELSKVKNAQKLIGQLFLLLKQIVAKMDHFKIETEQSLVETDEKVVGDQLKGRKFAKFMVEQNEWPKVKIINKMAFLSPLLGRPANAMTERQMMDNFEILLRKFEKLKTQRKLDELLFDAFINAEDEFLMNAKDESLMNAKNEFLVNIEDKFLTRKMEYTLMMYQISDGWQEINFKENMTKNMAKNSLIKQKVGINGKMEKERSDQWDAIQGMRNIFKQWSNEAYFQLPSLFYLKPFNELLSPICIVPNCFDILGKILGKIQCNLSNRMLCTDNSLFCIFCKNPLVKFLQKNSYQLAIPKLEINFMGTHFEVLFVVVPAMAFIPAQKFDGKNIRIMFSHFGKQILKLGKNSYLDAEDGEKDGQKRIEKQKQLRMSLEEELFSTDDDDRVTMIMEELEQLNSNKKTAELSNVTVETMERSSKYLEEITKIKENLSVFSEHSIPLSILMHLLTTEEMFKLHNNEDKNVLNGSTLSRFRTMYAFVELWAKEKNLFNECSGHFNSFVLIIMVTKVFMLFPGETSLPFLLQKFFLIYSLWHWPMPLQLSKKLDYDREFEFLNWSPAQHWFEAQQRKVDEPQIWMEMPIISPIFPHKNLANRIDPLNAKNIQNEFLKEVKHLTATKREGAYPFEESKKKK